MMRLTKTLAFAALLLTLAGTAQAREHLELAVGVTPTMIHDASYEAVSQDDLALVRTGIDVRFEVASLGKGIRLLPLISYRFGLDDGNPYGMLDTQLLTNDFVAGVRLRGWLFSWLGIFVEAHGGVLWARVTGEVDGDAQGEMTYDANGVRDTYRDDLVTWTVGGLGGLEVRVSPAWLAQRGIERFDFGAEIGAGYLRRGDLEVEPELQGGDEHSLAVGQTANWGEINLSGWVVQIAATFSFF